MTQDYNTQSKKLILPVYGRNIQKMVDFCITIEDRVERQKCAETIIKKMENFTPINKEREDYRRVLWDHLFIMSDFKLEADSPYPVLSREEYEETPKGHLDHDHQKRPRFRHYGRIVERMIAIAKALPEGEERTELSKKIALQMKKDYLNWNSRGVSNSKIFTELYDLSEGVLYLDELIFRMPDATTLLESNANSAPGKYKKGNGAGRSRNRKK